MDQKVCSLHGGKFLYSAGHVNFVLTFNYINRIPTKIHYNYFIFIIVNSSSEATPTGSKMGSLFADHNQGCATLTEGDDSGFCRSITSMTSSASSIVMTKSTPRFPSKGWFQIKFEINR